VCLVVCCLVPSLAFAQASITGVVKDSSGAVLPGVTVEASSPALIEKVRSAVTDEVGRYRIVDLRPGSDTVSFSLTGFQTVRREGIELPGSFTATVDAEMKVGSIQETVTVSGASPIVDVQSIRRQTVIDNEIISSIPVTRSYNSLMQLMPNTVTQAGAAMDTQVVPGMVCSAAPAAAATKGASTSTASASDRRSTAPACRRTSPTSAMRAR
jgi:carboxypeptidase family protein